MKTTAKTAADLANLYIQIDKQASISDDLIDRIITVAVHFVHIYSNYLANNMHLGKSHAVQTYNSTSL